MKDRLLPIGIRTALATVAIAGGMSGASGVNAAGGSKFVCEPGTIPAWVSKNPCPPGVPFRVLASKEPEKETSFNTLLGDGQIVFKTEVPFGWKTVSLGVETTDSLFFADTQDSSAVFLVDVDRTGNNEGERSAEDYVATRAKNMLSNAKFENFSYSDFTVKPNQKFAGNQAWEVNYTREFTYDKGKVWRTTFREFTFDSGNYIVRVYLSFDSSKANQALPMLEKMASMTTIAARDR